MAMSSTPGPAGSVHHLLSGSYTNYTLFMLAFDTAARSLTLNSTVPGYGLHQFVTSNAARDRVYATAMTEPPQLFSWSVDDSYEFTHLNTVNVTSSSCYFSGDGELAFSAGGPTARINQIGEDGSIGDQVYEMLFVPKEDLEDVDKSRDAVLYGAHGFDVNVNNMGFVPHLEMNSIFMYEVADNGTAALKSINLSPAEGDGPRNTLPSDDGKLLYVITEHCKSLVLMHDNRLSREAQYLDVYEIGETQLRHVQRRSAIPDDMRGQYTYRGNAVQPSRDGKYLFTSTRGWNNTEANGWVAAFQLDDHGYLKMENASVFYEAPLTLGSAGGLRVADWEDETNGDPQGLTDYMYLSDTSEGYMYILGWTPSKQKFEEVASFQYPQAAPYEAVWLD